MDKYIGVLTYNSFDILNYGGVLQGFALNKKTQEYLKSHYIVKNYNYSLSTTYSSSLKKVISHIYKGIICIIPSEIKRKKRTKSFYNSFLDGVSVKPSNFHAYSASKYVFTIIGSDQVWNPLINNFDKNFALEGFESGAVATYAASFGSPTCPEKYLQTLKNNSTKLKVFSVREQSGADILKEFSNTIRVDLDPTLLLEREEWNKVLEETDAKTPKEKYIFCYLMPGDKDVINAMVKAAKIISKHNGLKCIFCGQKHFSLLGCKKVFSLGPLEWVKYLNNADFVVTNSFHGVAFSENLGKPFVYVRNTSKLTNISMLSSRVVDFLNMLHEEYRIIDSSLKCLNYIDLAKTNKLAETILRAKREDSLKYLKGVCDEIIKK